MSLATNGNAVHTSVCAVWLNLLPAAAVTRALTPNLAAAMGTAASAPTTGVRPRVLNSNSGTLDACQVPPLCPCDPRVRASGILSPVTVPTNALPKMLIRLLTLLVMLAVPAALLDSAVKLLLAEASGLLRTAAWLPEASVNLLMAEAPGLLRTAAWLPEASVNLLMAGASSLLRTAAWRPGNDVLQDAADQP